MKIFFIGIQTEIILVEMFTGFTVIVGLCKEEREEDRHAQHLNAR